LHIATVAAYNREKAGAEPDPSQEGNKEVSITEHRQDGRRIKVSKGKTIVEVVKDGLCTGCGTCVGICPLDAVEMVIDRREGVYVPSLNKERCTECGLCFDVCPGHTVDFRQLNLEIFGKEPDDILVGNCLSCHTGYATDYNIRYNSASGGLVTSLLIFALKEGIIDGALVTRMKKDRPLEPEPFIARTREEIISAAKSKYCPVPANIALKEIMEREGRYAVVGIPCHFHGIRKAERVIKKLEGRVVLHLGLFCTSTPTFKGTERLLQMKGIPKDSVRTLDYRGQGWPGNMRMVLQDGSEKAFQFCAIWSDKTVGQFVFALPAKRCALCIEGSSELADISFGDAWMDKFRGDKVGRSVILCRNEIGRALLERARTSRLVEITELDTNEIIKAQPMLSLRKHRFASLVFLTRALGKNRPKYNQNLPKTKVPYRRVAEIKHILFFLLRSVAPETIVWYIYILWVRKRDIRRPLFKSR